MEIRLTNEAGEFTFAGLRKGTYVRVVRSLGYQQVRRRVLIGELSAFLDLGSVLQAMSTVPGVTVAAGGKVELRGSDKVLAPAEHRRYSRVT